MTPPGDHRRDRRPRRRLLATAAAGALALTACGVDAGVETLGAEPAGPPAGVASDTTTPAGSSADTTTPPAGTTDPVDTAPPTTVAPTTVPDTAPELPAVIEPELAVEVPIENVVDVDAGKPEREYDRFLGTALADIDQWWGRTFPVVYDDAWEPLAGGIYAGYPQRSTDIPGCGEPTTDPADLALFVAFYCQFGDFIVYDDASTEVLAPLATEFGPAVMGIVMAHEYGHAIQARIGALDRPLATIITEQQADCFAGAWTGQAYRGESDLLRLGDADVRAGLIAMLSVRDPVGTNQFVAGGHGSAFDRVGAFQVGFVEGPERCAELIDDPLDLVPNQFRSESDRFFGGDALYDCEELRDLGGTDEDVANCTPAPVFLAEDLNHFWATALGEFGPIAVQPLAATDDAACADPVVLADEAVFCTETRTLVYDEPEVLALYREFGDFTLGYFYGIAWAEAAQLAIDSRLEGERRALLNDCFTGAWVRDITPDENGATPRQGDRDGDGDLDGIESSPGDLDEAIQMAILEGDDGVNENVVGTAFEKIAALRVGALGGLGACQSEIGL